jgi:N-acetylglucosamine-6-phosphate deacetylase
MRPLHHRDPGPVAACLAAAARGELVVELVADGTHLADATVRTVFDLVGPDAILLVTDAMAAAGLGDGDYRLGPMDVRVADGVARIVEPDGSAGSIAGGVAHLLDVVRCTVGAGVPLVDAVRAASRTPADALGLRDVGRLEAGHRADLVVVDDGLRPRRVMRLGAWVTDQVATA